MAFQFYVIFLIFLKLQSLKLPTEVISLSRCGTIVAKGNEPPTAQDGFEISVLSRISILSRISKNPARNLMRLFLTVFYSYEDNLVCSGYINFITLPNSSFPRIIYFSDMFPWLH